MRLKVLALALIATLGFGVVGATAAKPKKVKSTVNIKFDPGTSSDPADPYANSSFFGKVRSSRDKCERGRTVVVRELNAAKVGQDRTDQDGGYTVPDGEAFENGPYAEPSRFYAFVKQKRKGKTICKAARSKRITAQ